jgi:hypothetical protein
LLGRDEGRRIPGNTTGGPACIVGIARGRFTPTSDDRAGGVVWIVT